jgi:hypothetical protein
MFGLPNKVPSTSIWWCSSPLFLIQTKCCMENLHPYSTIEKLSELVSPHAQSLRIAPASYNRKHAPLSPVSLPCCRKNHTTMWCVPASEITRPIICAFASLGSCFGPY